MPVSLAAHRTAHDDLDLFAPKPDAMAPLALFIHGGYWRSLEPSLFSQAARGANAHGIAVAVVGYDLCPQVTIAEIIDQIRHACLFLWLRTGRRMMISICSRRILTPWRRSPCSSTAGIGARSNLLCSARRRAAPMRTASRSRSSDMICARR